MNCKPGDLALVVCAYDPAAGMLLTVLERGELPGTLRAAPPFDGPLWRVDRAVAWFDKLLGITRMLPYFPDRYLLPIRPEADPEAALTEQEIAT